MHFNFHLDGNESPEKLRRIANAVLALGGHTLRIEESDLGLDSETWASPTTAYDEFGGETQMGDREPIVKTAETQELADIIRRGTPNAGERNDAGATPSVPVNPGSTTEALTEAGHVVSDSKRDVNGLPWDDRIHSSSRAVNADGSWRAKRGVDPGLVAAVEDELRAVVVHEAVSAPIPPAPPVPPTPPAPPANGRNYADVVNLIMSKKLSPEVYVAVLGESLPDFAKTFKANPAVADEMYEKLAGL